MIWLRQKNLKKITSWNVNPTISIIEKNLNCLSIKIIIWTFKTIKQLLRNNNNNKTKSYSDAGIYRICYQDYQRSCIGETSRDLPNLINEHKKDFESCNFSYTLVIYNISINHKFDFKRSNIIIFIHDKNKCRTIESSAISHYITPYNRDQDFIKYLLI